MRCPGILTVLTLLIAGGSCTCAAQESSAELFQELQSVETTDRAFRALSNQASDPQVRQYLEANLASLIEKGPKHFWRQWINGIQLAGRLRIAEAAPALAEYITVGDGETSIATHMRLDDAPAAKALAQIGDPAIPTLEGILESGDLQERRGADLVLYNMGSSKSEAVLRNRATREPDPEEREFLGKLTARSSSHEK